ncbi:putative ABC transport system ATP-binding protein [Natronocella acetinitrilica]|uniref:ABC transport system ATP-binding protein n=1 Tax=Natronocella acetinitrilica TaxID=414046 RepID=A0AAE3KBD7_9GAMM|nr:ATP-binding cassette domain-containing protein [Natronocella acetinitrilica]MCP1675395.1 putative ABC transport system ATP-binding protein [Natronocella acetinitrilica]
MSHPVHVHVSGLGFRHADGTTLQFPDWTLDGGSQWALIGPSGCGKTTLLQLLAGLRKPSSGSVQIGAQRLDQLSEQDRDRLRGRSIGIVFQTLYLLPTLSVLNNLLLAPAMAGLEPNRERALDLLRRLELDHLTNRHPDALSQGQAQRVAIARALMNRPALLLADEPTSALDDRACLRLLDLLKEETRLCAATLLVATHDQRVREALPSVQELTP